MVSSFVRRVINRATNSGAEHAARNQAEAMEDTCSASSRAAEARGRGGGARFGRGEVAESPRATSRAPIRAACSRRRQRARRDHGPRDQVML